MSKKSLLGKAKELKDRLFSKASGPEAEPIAEPKVKTRAQKREHRLSLTSKSRRQRS